MIWMKKEKNIMTNKRTYWFIKDLNYISNIVTILIEKKKKYSK